MTKSTRFRQINQQSNEPRNRVHGEPYMYPLYNSIPAVIVFLLCRLVFLDSDLFFLIGDKGCAMPLPSAQGMGPVTIPCTIPPCSWLWKVVKPIVVALCWVVVRHGAWVGLVWGDYFTYRTRKTCASRVRLPCCAWAPYVYIAFNEAYFSIRHSCIKINTVKSSTLYDPNKLVK